VSLQIWTARACPVASGLCLKKKAVSYKTLCRSMAHHGSAQDPTMDLHRAMIPNPFQLSCSLTFACATELNFLSWSSDAHESFGVESIVWFIVGSICKQFRSCWCACIIRIWFWLIHWLFVFRCFFCRSGLFECWIWLYVLGRRYGCTLYRKTRGFICPFVVIDTTN
jgi:hypothetical protein